MTEGQPCPNCRKSFCLVEGDNGPHASDSGWVMDYYCDLHNGLYLAQPCSLSDIDTCKVVADARV